MLRTNSLLTAGARTGRRFTSTGQKDVQSSEQANMPRHRSKFEYEASRKETRAATDAESGGRESPSAFQRRMLVITGLYKKTSDIPEYVSSQTMNRLHDRNRVVFIISAVAFVFLVGLSAEQWISRKIEKEKAAGKSVMGLHAMTLKFLGIRTAVMDERTPEEEYKLQKLQDKSMRYSGVPAIPSDIGFNASKTTGGDAQKGGIVAHVAGNPLVIVGMGLTTYALLGMMRKSFLGDRLGAQKYMQYRIMAQFFTVTALVAGVAIFGATYEPTNKKI